MFTFARSSASSNLRTLLSACSNLRTMAASAPLDFGSRLRPRLRSSAARSDSRNGATPTRSSSPGRSSRSTNMRSPSLAFCPRGRKSANAARKGTEADTRRRSTMTRNSGFTRSIKRRDFILTRAVATRESSRAGSRVLPRDGGRPRLRKTQRRSSAEILNRGGEEGEAS